MSEAGEQPAARGGRLKAQLWLAAKIAVSLVTLAIVFTIVPPQRLWSMLAGMRPAPFVAAIAIFSLVQLGACFRTTQVASALGGRLPFRRALELNYISLWMSQVLPSSFGGDVAKGAYLVDQLGVRRAVHVVLIDRLAGVAVMLAAIALFLPAYMRYFQGSSFIVFAAIVIGLIAAGVVGVLVLARFGASWHFAPLNAIGLMAQDMLASLRWPQSVHIGWTSTLIHVNGVVTYFLIGQALGIEAEFFHYWLIVPLVYIAALFPLAMAGWGVREASAIWLFGLAGVPSDSGLALAVSYGIFLLITSLPGVIPLMTARLRGGAGKAEPPKASVAHPQ